MATTFASAIAPSALASSASALARVCQDFDLTFFGFFGCRSERFYIGFVR